MGVPLLNIHLDTIINTITLTIIISAALSKVLFTLTNTGLNNLYNIICYSHTVQMNPILDAFVKKKAVRASIVKRRTSSARESC